MDQATNYQIGTRLNVIIHDLAFGGEGGGRREQQAGEQDGDRLHGGSYFLVQNPVILQ